MVASALHELEPAAEWRAGDIADPAAWTLQRSADDHAELDAALAVAKQKSADPLELGRDDFPLDVSRASSTASSTRSSDGRGFARSPRSIRPATATTTSRSSTGASACISASPGRRTSTATSWATSPIRARPSTIPPVRGNELGGIALDYHTDGSDLVGQIRLRVARAGGLSCVANAVAIHNQLVRSGPISRRRSTNRCLTISGASRPRAPRLIFRSRLHRARRAAVRAILPEYILASQRHPDVPRLGKTALRPSPRS